MHALRDVTVKSTDDLERAYFYLGFRLLVLDEKDLALYAKIRQELVNRGALLEVK